MKIRFFRFTAALLAGAALLAAGCTDFGADIKSVEDKYAELPGKVASLESQLGALQATLATTYETIANHEADMQGLRDDISALLDAKLDKSTYEAFQASVANAQEVLAGLKYADKDFVNQVAALLKDLAALTAGDWTAAGVKYATVQEYIDGEIARLENRLSKAEKAIEDLTKTGGVIDQLKKAIADLQSGKLDEEDFTAYKEATAVTIGLLQDAIKALTSLTGGFPEDKTIKEYIDAVSAKLDDYVLTSTFTAFTATVVTQDKLTELQSELDGRLKALEDLLKGEWGDKTVQEYIDAEIADLASAIKTLKEEILPKIQKDITDLQTGKLDKAVFDSYKEATAVTLGLMQNAIDALAALTAGFPEDKTIKEYVDAVAKTLADLETALNGKIAALDGRLTILENVVSAMLSRVQSIVLVPAFDDGKLSVVGSGAEVNTFKVMPTDAAQAVVEAFAADPTSFSLDVKTVETRAGGEVPLKLTVTDVKLNAANADKGWVDVSVNSNFNTLSAADQAKSYSAALVIDGPGASISSPFYNIYVDKKIVRLKLTPDKDIELKWDYKYYKDICDTLISKIWVDGDRDKLIGSGRTETSKNVVSGTDYTQGVGAITTHTNASTAIDINLCSHAEYGVSDSTYVSTYQQYDSVDDITYIGELYYVVKARPADAVIELDPVEAKVGDPEVVVDAITALYNYHKTYYSRYTLADLLPDFVSGVTIDSKKVTVDGAPYSASVGCNFGYNVDVERTYFSVNLDKAGAWKIYVYTHFANVGYTFVIPVNVE